MWHWETKLISCLVWSYLSCKMLTSCHVLTIKDASWQKISIILCYNLATSITLLTKGNFQNMLHRFIYTCRYDIFSLPFSQSIGWAINIRTIKTQFNVIVLLNKKNASLHQRHVYGLPRACARAHQLDLQRRKLPTTVK